MAEMKPSGWYYVIECNSCKQALHVMDDGAQGSGQERQLPHMELELICSCTKVDRYNAASARRVQIPPVQG
jgi:hypothetical protein